MSEPTPDDASLDHERLADLTDEFARRYRRGERPTVEDYARQHPALASQIRELFPAMLVMEQSSEAAAPQVAPASERIGAAVGRYKLLERLGEGGFGTVFMAEQQHPVRRKVALKLVKAGVDTKRVIARFEAERQALALMDHPNIAKVFDAGTTDAGRPFFVMELVKGVPITTYCDDLRLTPEQRLELFVPVCQAVQHAHQKGVIHRDLKPSNVLVALYDGKPVPKVIDFGVAKATAEQLTERTMFTGFGEMVGTLQYMSPEQAELNQLDVDTRSDIYSLGVLLYELLTGTTPLEGARLKQAALLEALRVIREEEPPRPSTRLSTSDRLPSIAANRGLEPRKLSGIVRGELDWIVMKCLEKDRARRYATANGLAADMRRYLDNEPLEACPPGAWYRVRKFAARHKGTMSAAGLILFVLIGGVVGTSWQAVRANRQRELAVGERDAKQAALAAETAARRQVMEALASLTDDVVERQLARQPSLTEADRAFLKKIASHYESFAALKGDTRESRAVRAEGNLRVGTLRRKLGDVTETRAAWERARELFAGLVTDFPSVPEYRLGLSGIHNNLGSLLTDLGHHDAAERAFRDAIAIIERLVADGPTVPQYRHRLAMGYNGLGNLFKEQGKDVEAENQHRRARAVLEKLIVDFPAEWEYRASLSRSHRNLGALLAGAGKRAEAQAEYQRAIALFEQLAAEFPLDPTYRRYLAGTHDNVAILFAETGKVAEAEREFTQALAVHRQLAADFPAAPDYRHGLGRAHNNFGHFLKLCGRHGEAQAQHRHAIAVEKQLADDFPAVPDYRADLSASHNNLGSVLALQGESAEAEREYRTALALTERLEADFPTVPDYRLGCAVNHNSLGILLADLGRSADAEIEYRLVIDLFRRLTSDFPAVPEYRMRLAASHNNLAGLLLQFGKDGEGEVELRRAIELFGQLGTEFPDVPDYRTYLGHICNNLADLLAKRGDTPGATDAYRRAIGAFRGLAGQFPAQADFALDWAKSCRKLGTLLGGNGQVSEASDCFAEAIEALKDLVQRQPRQTQARALLRDTHRDQAETLEALARFADALVHWDRAIALSDGPERTRAQLRRAACLVRAEFRNATTKPAPK